MPSVYPHQIDIFTEPSAPASTPLDSAGTGDRNHWQHHRDLGDAIEAVQIHAAKDTHIHDGTDGTAKLDQANTHQNVDTDSGPTAIHHTLGKGANQASPGNHEHQAEEILNLGYRLATSQNRPNNPAIGTTIIETDTACIRSWIKLPWEDSPRWVLLPNGNKPVLRLLQGTQQRIPGPGAPLEFRIEEEDTFNYFNAGQSMHDINVTEPGLYEIACAVSWSPSDIFGDHSHVGLVVNGQLTFRISADFIRGSLFQPGFSQVVHLPPTNIRLNAGDTVSIRVWHNGLFSQWTFINRTNTNNLRDTRLDMIYKGV